jgi:hypothetical protein
VEVILIFIMELIGQSISQIAKVQTTLQLIYVLQVVMILSQWLVSKRII